MPDQPIAAFKNDPHAETVFEILVIGNTDTEFTFDVYTRNPRNAKLALEDLKLAIDALLDEWSNCKSLPPATASDKMTYLHSGGIWLLRIPRPSGS